MYKINIQENTLEKVKRTSYKENNIMERDNIQEWIRKDPSILGEELIIIAHEYDKFEVNERLDLLAIDKEGNLVVIEVKRDNTGGSVDFQSLKYCSYCSTLTPNQIVEMYEEYLEKFNIDENPIENIMNFLEVELEDMLNSLLNTSQRIVIIGGEIDKRILSSAAWLSKNNIDIKCITIEPYLTDDGNEILIDVNQVIPVYDINDYFINKKNIDKSKGKLVQPDDIIEFFNAITSMATSKGHKGYYNARKPYMKIYSEVDSKIVFGLNYAKRENEFRIELSGRNTKASKQLLQIYNANKEIIQKELGYECCIKEGIKNSDWLRVYYNIDCDNKDEIQKEADEIGLEFIKFVEVFKKYLKS